MSQPLPYLPQYPQSMYFATPDFGLPSYYPPGLPQLPPYGFVSAPSYHFHNHVYPPGNAQTADYLSPTLLQRVAEFVLAHENLNSSGDQRLGLAAESAVPSPRLLENLVDSHSVPTPSSLVICTNSSVPLDSPLTSSSTGEAERTSQQKSPTGSENVQSVARPERSTTRVPESDRKSQDHTVPSGENSSNLVPENKPQPALESTTSQVPPPASVDGSPTDGRAPVASVLAPDLSIEKSTRHMASSRETTSPLEIKFEPLWSPEDYEALAMRGESPAPKPPNPEPPLQDVKMDAASQQAPEPTKTTSSGLPPPDSKQPPRACSGQRVDALPPSETRSSPVARSVKRQREEQSVPSAQVAPSVRAARKPRNKKHRKRDRSDTSSRIGSQAHSSSPANNPEAPSPNSQPKKDPILLAKSLKAGECVKITYRDAGILSYVSGIVSRIWDGKTFELRALGPSRRRSSAGDREGQPLLCFPTAQFELHKIVRVSGQRFRRIVTSATSVKDIIHSK